MSKLKDLTGMRFGRLTVLGKADSIKSGNQIRTAWGCLCDCGNEVVVIGTNLKKGTTRSCGCLREEVRKTAKANTIKHHGYGTRLYRIYRGMWQRCYDKNVSQYPRYGGRGITIADEWLGEHGFERFRDWAYANNYVSTLSIDRIDNSKGYTPDNCRWATVKEQQNNRRCNVYITVNGITHTMAEWADITGIKPATIKSRRRAGWSDKDIVLVPVRGT